MIILVGFQLIEQTTVTAAAVYMDNVKMRVIRKPKERKKENI